MMRHGHLALGLSALLVLYAGRVVAGNVEKRVVLETNGEIRVELIDRTPVLNAPVASFFVAISDSGSFNAVVNDPAGGTTTLGLSVRGPFVYRGTRTLFIDLIRIPPPRFGRNPSITVTWTPSVFTQTRSTADPMLRNLVINPAVFPARAGVNRTDPWFSLGARWVRGRVNARGMYTVTGGDLQQCGIDPRLINDPGTIRVFTNGGLEQSRFYGGAWGTWRDGRAMRETPVVVEDGGDGVFDIGDRIVFYALSGEDWANYYDPAASDSVFQRNRYASSSMCWITWDSAIPGPPLRMGRRDSSPGAGPIRTTWKYREHHERDLVAEFGFRGDGWLWLNVLDNRTRILDAVNVVDLASSRPQVFRTGAMSKKGGVGHHALYSLSRGTSIIPVGEITWNTQQRVSSSQIPVRIVGNFLANGANTFRYQMPRDINPLDETFFEWYAVEYERRIRASGGRVAFSTPDTSVSVTARASGLPGQGTLRAYDVSDAWNPVELTGFATVPEPGGTRSVTLSTGPAGSVRHTEVTATAGLRRMSGLSCVPPVDLRAQSGPVHMLIITHPSLRQAAETLAAYRRNHLPGYGSGVVRVLTTDDVYDNFSAGIHEPMALRNAIRFYYDHYTDARGNHSLAYVLLIGDATDDFRNRLSSTPDLVPTVLNLEPASEFTYVTDAWYGHLDAADHFPGRSVPDVAIGRIPAGGIEDARAAVNRIIDYEQRSDLDSWRKKIILVADDEKSAVFPTACELWTLQSEQLALTDASDVFDVEKVYLTEYPLVSGIKPASRQALVDAWNDGAIAINYIGHGSNRQMADEIVFVDTDVNVLNNGIRRPILTALSCTIGQFANPGERSLTEKLLFRAEGGIIGAVTASNESFSGQNNVLNRSLYRRLAPRRAGGVRLPLGSIAMDSQFESLVKARNSVGQEDNNWKYNLFGDPAMTLAVPEQDIRFDAVAGDSLIAGLRTSVSGAVFAGGAVDTTFDGSVRVEIREPMTRRNYLTRCASQTRFDYLLPGGMLFNGTADVTAGRFSVEFRVPRFSARGTLAQASAIAWSGARTAGATEDSLLQVVAPTLADSSGLVPLDGAPRVSLRFKSGLNAVKPGETVQAVVRDADGISILETTNEGRQAVLFDDVPVPIAVNSFFEYVHGGADTAGVLSYPLPELEAGVHRMVYKVADSFGQIALDTLEFEVTDPLDYRAEVVLNYPNPFASETRFLLRLSDRAHVRLNLYTVSGRRIRALEARFDRGERWMLWDGRDALGDEVANGSYLYVARVRFEGADRPQTILRGAVMKIR